MQWVCSALMSKDREQRARGPESSYRVYRSGSKGITRPDRPAAATDAGREAGKGRSGGRSTGSPYSRYHSRPRGLIARPVTLGFPTENSHGSEIMHRDAPGELTRLLLKYLRTVYL